MASIMTDGVRVIIADFAKEILTKQLRTAKPSKEVINFRTDIRDQHEREIVKVPIELLRYRKDNGRIASDVADFEKNLHPLDETKQEDQDRIAKFLADKDPEKTETLTKSVLQDGQRSPAIITCDGFLINGNRRKYVMEVLHKDFPNDERFAYMNVVILPGKDDEGGPPTLVEIERLENRYQLQSDGKSEYYGFDRALSIRRKMQMGLTLKEQLRDDPRHAKADDQELKRAMEECKRDYLDPLECVDRYLIQFGREGQYRSISTGVSDKEGRWQAFIDYSNTLNRVFKNPAKLNDLGIEEDEVGTIEEAAFDIIRLRAIPDMPKVHKIMRDLPKYCRTKEGKKFILAIPDKVDAIIPHAECQDKSGSPLPADQVDAKWVAKHQQVIIQRVKQAAICHEAKKEKEEPLDLLRSAYEKLNHDNLSLKNLGLPDLHKVREIVKKIGERTCELEDEVYKLEKNWNKNLKKLQGDQ